MEIHTHWKTSRPHVPVHIIKLHFYFGCHQTTCIFFFLPLFPQKCFDLFFRPIKTKPTPLRVENDRDSPPSTSFLNSSMSRVVVQKFKTCYTQLSSCLVRYPTDQPQWGWRITMHLQSFIFYILQTHVQIKNKSETSTI